MSRTTRARAGTSALSAVRGSGPDQTAEKKNATNFSNTRKFVAVVYFNRPISES